MAARGQGGDAPSGYARCGHNCNYWRCLGAAWAGLLTTAGDMAVLYQLLLHGKLNGLPRLLGPAAQAEFLRCHTRGPADGPVSGLPAEIRAGGRIYGNVPGAVPDIPLVFRIVGVHFLVLVVIFWCLPFYC